MYSSTAFTAFGVRPRVGMQHERNHTARDAGRHAGARQAACSCRFAALLLREPQRAAGGGDRKQVVARRDDVGLREAVVPRRPARAVRRNAIVERASRC